MRKRIISTCMALLLLAGFAANAACGTENTSGSVYETERSEEILTREQWIIGLGSVFGMNEYVTEEPFFTDVESTEEVYPFLQSCAEWGIFKETGTDFEPDHAVTREYAVQTAVMAAEVLNDITDDSIYEECISYALGQGIINSDKEDYLEETLTYAQGQEILDWALEQYQNREFVEYEDVVLQEDVIDLSDYGTEIISNGDVTTFSGALTEELEIGDVFIAPATAENPAGVAKKVVSVEEDMQGNLLVTTEEPALEEVYAALDFAAFVVPEADDIIVYEGVTISSVEENHNMVCAQNAVLNEKGPVYTVQSAGYVPVASSPSFSLNVNFTKGDVKLNGEWKTSLGKFKADLAKADEEIGADVEEAGELYEKSNTLYSRNDETKQQVIEKIDNKFTGGYEITGKLEISDISAAVEVNPKKVLGVPVGVENLLINTNYKISSTLSFKGELKEKIMVAAIPVPVGSTGASITFEVYVYANANGELKVECTTSSNTILNYESGKIKKTSDTTGQTMDIEGCIAAEAGAGVTAKLKCFSIPVTDVGVKAGVKFEFSSDLASEVEKKETDTEYITVQTWKWTVEGTRTFPIVTLTVGAEKDSLLKLDLSWELVGSKGLIKVQSYEMFKKELDLGSEVLERESKDDTEDTEKLTDNTENEADSILSDKEVLDIDTYTLMLKNGEAETIDVTAIPKEYEENELQWSSDNTSVATVSDGIVSAVGAGTATVTLSTKDGKYKISCTIIVSDDEEVEFHSL